VLTFSIKREIRKFHVVVVQRQERNVQKKRDARAKLLFCQSKPIAFLPFSWTLTTPSSLLELPNSDFLYAYSQANQIGEFCCGYH